jgi:hypothetical protein
VLDESDYVSTHCTTTVEYLLSYIDTEAIVPSTHRARPIEFGAGALKFDAATRDLVFD